MKIYLNRILCIVEVRNHIDLTESTADLHPLLVLAAVLVRADV